MLKRTLEANECSIDLKNLSWTKFNTKFLSQLPKIDFIIGSDIFFSGKLFEGFFDFITINKYLFYLNFFSSRYNSIG